MGSRPARTTFVALRALSCVAFPPAEAGGRPSIRLRPPSEDTPRKPHIATARSPGHKGRHREPRQVLPLVDFGHPTAHTSTVNRVLASGSLRRHTCHVRGLITPFATYSPRLPARPKPSRSAHGFHSPRGSPRRDGSTFRWPCPLDVTAYAAVPPEGGRPALRPPSRLRSRVESVQHRGAPSTSLGLPRPSIPS